MKHIILGAPALRASISARTTVTAPPRCPGPCCLWKSFKAALYSKFLSTVHSGSLLRASRGDRYCHLSPCRLGPEPQDLKLLFFPTWPFLPLLGQTVFQSPAWGTRLHISRLLTTLGQLRILQPLFISQQRLPCPEVAPIKVIAKPYLQLLYFIATQGLTISSWLSWNSLCKSGLIPKKAKTKIIHNKNKHTLAIIKNS